MKKRILPALIGSGLIFALVLAGCQNLKSESKSSGSINAAVQDFSVDPAEPAYPEAAAGVAAYVDNYDTNQTSNKTAETNAAVRLLIEFEELWGTAGWAQDYPEGYKNGTVKNASALSANVAYVVGVTGAERTADQETAAYFDDRRGKTYSTITGFGPLSDLVYNGAGVTTTTTDVPADATVYKYDDKGIDYKGVGTDSPLYDMIQLIVQTRANGASSNPSKYYFNYPRPWRLSDDSTITEDTVNLDTGYYATNRTTAVSYPTYTSNVTVVPALKPARGTTPATDGGFPSGHTAESFNSGVLMAYAVPERFQELLTRASELGENRIRSGMHSPMDVMGGRILGIAISAAGLNEADFVDYKEQAFKTAHEWLIAQTGTTEETFYDYAHGGTSANDDFADHEANRALYLQRMTYGFEQTGASGAEAVVPKGAEALIETRFPYLNASQRREILRTTAIDSGYPLLDDAEGWGRINLFDAADGYGSFAGTIYVNMDASLVSSTLNGFYGFDTWRNAISGTGRLVKQGTGTLCLSGNNTYSGGTNVQEGTLKALSGAALGSSDVKITGGILEIDSDETVEIGGWLIGSGEGTLAVNRGSGSAGLVEVSEGAACAGTLEVAFAAAPEAGSTVTILKAGKVVGSFATVNVSGTALAYTVSYEDSAVVLKF